MGQTPANVQRKTFKDFQKACSKPLEKQTSLALRKQNIFFKERGVAKFCTVLYIISDLSSHTVVAGTVQKQTLQL